LALKTEKCCYLLIYIFKKKSLTILSRNEKGMGCQTL
jgi:hypothetical protein